MAYIRLCVKVDLRAAEPSNARDAPEVEVTANRVLRRMLPPDVNGRLLKAVNCISIIGTKSS